MTIDLIDLIVWDDEDADVCGETYDHNDETTYEDAETRQWVCRICGAKGWEDHR